MRRYNILDLSPREIEVCKLVSKGYPSKQIATLLDIGVRTVESYRYRINTKVGAHSVVDVINYANEYLSEGLKDG